MVLAGPGSGKTTVITHRVKYLIEECGILPSQVLTITFSRAAAREMQQRFAALVSGRVRPLFGTFHSVFFGILKTAYHYGSESVLDPAESLLIVRRILQSLPQEEETEEEQAEAADELKNAISLVKNDRLDPETCTPPYGTPERFREVYRAYQAELERRGQIDFDDMLLQTYELLSARPDICEVLQRRWPYLQVDEFQDINRVQYDTLRLLAGDAANVFIVGDDDQSIYRFRGARPEIMLGFEKDFPGTRRILLDINYRSTQRIVRAAGNLIAHNVSRFPKAIRAVRGEGERLVLTNCRDQKEMAASVREKIDAYAAAGIPYREMAVLYRTAVTAAPLYRELSRTDIPIRTRDGIPNLFEHWIAKDFFAYLRLAMGDRTRKTVLQVLNRPNRFIAREALKTDPVSFDSLRWELRERSWMVERVDKWEMDLSLMSRMRPGAAIHYLRQSAEYDRFLEEYAARQRVNADDWKEIADSLEESAAGFATAEEWFYHAEEATAAWHAMEEKNAARADADRNQVTFSTMHGAKGLEFAVVFVVAANEGVTPHRLAESAEEMEEERRLFYVAMTRAKDRLHLMVLDELYRKKAQRSRFITEISKAPEAAGK